MKTCTRNIFVALAVLALSTLHPQLSTCSAQGTAFTYQGQLNEGGAVANGSYDLTFALFGVSSGAGQVGNTVINTATAVSNGLFTVTLDFGNQFPGPDRWLEIGVRTNGGGAFATLAPRQPLTPTPYAITASNLSGTLPATQLSGTIASGNLPASPFFAGTVTALAGFAGSGANVINLNPVNIAGIIPLTGLPASLVTNNASGVTLSGTFNGNGGGLTNLNASQLTSGTVPLARLSGLTSNQLDTATWQLATNLNGGFASLASNLISGINITNAFITNSTFAGNGAGLTNLTATNLTGIIPDARLSANVAFLNGTNVFTGTNTFAGVVNATNVNNTIKGTFTGAFSGNGANLTNLNASQLTSGAIPLAQLPPVVVTNGASGVNISGTFNGNGANVTNVNAVTLGGLAASNFWQVGGNNVSAGQFLGSVNEQAVEILANGRRALRLEPNTDGCCIAGTASVIGGSSMNYINPNAIGSTIAGGGAWGDYGMAASNSIENFSYFGFIGGGEANKILGGQASTIGGGNKNTVNGYYATIPGGYNNSATNYAFAAGNRAKANNQGTFVWADSQNADFTSTANDQFLIRAQGGVGINTNNPGASSLSVYGANTGGWPSPTTLLHNGSTAANASPALVAQGDGNMVDGVLAVRSTGTGYLARFGTANAGWLVDILTNGAIVTSNTITANGVLLSSDRNAKENFTPLDSQSVLAKVAALPITEWNYKNNDGGVHHVGPMAQDFQAAFGLNGTDDKHISMVDESGVALAAIQGLNQKLSDELKQKETEITELKQRLDKLEQLVNSKTGEAK